MNLLEAPLRDGAAVLGELRIPIPRSAEVGERVILGVRPESWDVVGSGTQGTDGTLSVDAELLEELGAESFVYARAAGADWSSRTGRIVARVDRRFTVEPGARLRLRPRSAEVFFFDAITEKRLR
jgi:sn-glycerol 3-phosphate transport system ATP-binding protein